MGASSRPTLQRPSKLLASLGVVLGTPCAPCAPSSIHEVGVLSSLPQLGRARRTKQSTVKHQPARTHHWILAGWCLTVLCFVLLVLPSWSLHQVVGLDMCTSRTRRRQGRKAPPRWEEREKQNGAPTTAKQPEPNEGSCLFGGCRGSVLFFSFFPSRRRFHRDHVGVGVGMPVWAPESARGLRPTGPR